MNGDADTIPVERGEGIYFWDYNGKRYADMCSQLGNVNLGYGNKEMIEAAKKQLDILPYVAPARASGPGSKLAKMIVDRAPENMAKVFFACGGSDSNEAAINMARNYTGRSKIFSMYRSYHGSTLVAAVRKDFAKKYPKVVVNYVKSQLAAIDEYKNKQDEAIEKIAKTAGITKNDAKFQVKTFSYPDGNEQVKDDYLGTKESKGKLADTLKATADFLKEQGSIDKSPDLQMFKDNITGEFVEKALKE